MSQIELPIVVLGIGEFSIERKLLAVGGSSGIPVMIPIFTDPEKAELYRQWQEERLRALTLPISIGVGGDTDPEEVEINPLVISTAEKARDVMEVVMITARITMVAINPSVNGSPCLCMEIDEFLESIVDI